ncbi:DoxX family protein [Cupriavidus sp. D39]|uniref:DoxX family protein n=1 Tax=Cupriavidus sp. D39 TaxID=2997877 RepID=UPI002270E26D|nr:DoxX family protein [Cupriavidus sp. D39]MCY0852560.1 DoxX family protein [Cupriavidus sp. D39]
MLHASSSSAPFVALAARLATPAVRWLALLGLCAAYLQGGLTKATDFPSAIAEMNHFGLFPPAPLAILVILLELGASLKILSCFYRWLGALALAGFTLLATFLANQFWSAPMPERLMLENSFFEHLGLVGGFLLVAWHDLRDRAAQSAVP